LLKIHILNVDHGDSIILEYDSEGGKSFALIDSNISKNSPIPPALTKLQSLGATHLSFVSLTHPHDDHYLGLLQVLQYYNGEVDNFFSYPTGLDTAARREKLTATFKKAVSETDSPRLHKSAIEFCSLLRHLKDSIKFSNWEEYTGPDNTLYAKGFNGVSIKVILPHPKAKGLYFSMIDNENQDLINSPDLNDLSLAFRVKYAGVEVILGGDGPGSKWNYLKRTYDRQGQELNGEFVKLPHHGSKKDCTDKVLQFLFDKGDDNRKLALISANGRSHPDDDVIQNINDHNIHPYCTNLTRLCRANIEKINFSNSITPELNNIINWFEDHSEQAVQPCQGDIEISIDASGDIDVKTEYDHPCIFRGDYDFLKV